MYSKRTAFFTLLALCTGLFACRESLQVDDSDKLFPLELRLESDPDAVRLSWDPANISNFDRYVVLRSRNPIPPGLRPITGGGDPEVVFQSDDPNVTSFEDKNLPIAQQLYYKVYVGFEERFVESDNKSAAFSNLVFDGGTTHVRFVVDSNWVILGDQNAGTLQIIDYKSGTLLAKRSGVPFTSSDNMCNDVVVENGETVLYWWAGYDNLFKYKLPTLTELPRLPAFLSGFALLSISDDVLLTAQYDFNEAVTVRRKSDFGVVRGHYRNDYFSRRSLLMLNPSSKRVLETSPYQMLIYNVNPASGTFSSVSEVNLSSFFGQFLTKTPVSRDRQYFMPLLDGKIYDQFLNEVAQLPQQFNANFVDACFAPDGTAVYGLYIDFSTGNNTRIHKFRFPSMEPLGVRNFAASPASIEATNDNKVMLIATIFGNGPQTLLKPLNF
jgi:hypothetical protein